MKHSSFDGVVRPLIEVDDILVHALVPLLDARVVLYLHFLELDRRVKRAASRDEVCMRMMTVPSVGPIASLTFKAAIDDPTRFKRSRTVGAHFGLTPRRYQSGEHDNSGRISKAGNRNVRATLYAAAIALLKRTMAGSQIKSCGMLQMRTKGRRRAVVAVARKLAVLLHRIWITACINTLQKDQKFQKLQNQKCSTRWEIMQETYHSSSYSLFKKPKNSKNNPTLKKSKKIKETDRFSARS